MIGSFSCEEERALLSYHILSQNPMGVFSWVVVLEYFEFWFEEFCIDFVGSGKWGSLFTALRRNSCVACSYWSELDGGCCGPFT